jgi:hypothetical protein
MKQVSYEDITLAGVTSIDVYSKKWRGQCFAETSGDFV